MDVKLETDAYLIRCYCDPLGWDCTRDDIATTLNMTPGRVARVLKFKKWENRIRVLRLADFDDRVDYRSVIDAQLDGIGFRNTMAAVAKPDVQAG